MTRHRTISLAHALALLSPAALLGGALAFQFIGGLPPCEMCHWQRWPHLAAIAIGLLALFVQRSALLLPLVVLAGLAILVSGGIGLFHAGVELHWWQGLTRCSSVGIAVGGTPSQFLTDMLATPMIRCDAIPWSLWGVSLAGWNAMLSGLAGVTVIWLSLKRP